jgi:hypothetical protein
MELFLLGKMREQRGGTGSHENWISCRIMYSNRAGFVAASVELAHGSHGGNRDGGNTELENRAIAGEKKKEARSSRLGETNK